MNGKKDKKILLIGGRSKAKSMAVSLLEQGYQVTAINDTYEDCLKLAEIKGLKVIYGNGTRPYILEEAGAEDFDIAIALTSKDEDNLVACQLCKKKYAIRKTVSLVGDPNKTEFFYKMGVNSVVCAVSAVTGIIQQQAFIDEMTNIIPFGKGRVQIIEVRIQEGSPAAGKKLWEITLPKEGIVGCILRGDATLIPKGNTRILVGDTLVVITGSGEELNTIHALTGR
ncbi:MAG: NAD-binding protein [Anaerolineaceae bacterium]|nr:NAD-binding protein [Anaerolineaceae bacterium]